MLGLGRIARTRLLPALAAAEGAELWSLLSRDRARAAAAADEFGAGAAVPAHDDLDTLLADPDLDAVILASPDKLHAPQAVAAARAGKHVFSEKPMATSVAEARAMVNACREAGVKLGVAYHLRWHAAHRPLWQAVQSGRFGALRHLRVQWSFQAAGATDWRASPEVGRWWSLAAVGTHCLDQVLWFAGREGEITGFTSLVSRPVWGGAHDETAVVGLRFASGATAEFCCSVTFSAPGRFELYAADGYAIGEGTMATTGAGTLHTHEGPWPYQPGDPYRAEIEDFAAAIRDDRPPEVDGEAGLRNVELLVRAIEEGGG